jgi:hypothetical protein
MRMMRTLLFVGMALVATSVRAADSFPGGVFGQADGCRYAKTGESSGADDFLLIDRDAITTSVAVCQIKKATMEGASAAKLVLSCESEGESGDDEAATASLRNGAWTVRLADGTVFGPAKRCP